MTQQSTQFNRGFTLIELLVIIAIIGLMATLTVLALGSARQKTRDAKRVTDIKQIQVALQLYHSERNSYPLAADRLALGEGVSCDGAPCLTISLGNGLAATASGTTYLTLVPANPLPGGASYTYASLDGQTYELTFSLEGPIGEFIAPNCIARPERIDCAGAF